MDLNVTWFCFKKSAMRWSLTIFATLAISWLYRNALAQTIESFNDPLGCMSHGWLIPLFSLHALWQQRASLRASEKRYSLAGILGLLAATALLWLENRYSLLWLRQLSFIGMLWSLIYTLWGREVARLTLFPLGYLAFTISVPALLEDLVGYLQIIAATASSYLMCGFNVEVLQEGHALYSPVQGSEFRFDIAGACSGIRSLLALTAFTALYAWHSQNTTARKWLLFLCSIPIAVLCNIIRVFSICLIAAVFGEATALGYYHSYSGYVIALVAIMLIFKAGVLSEKLPV